MSSERESEAKTILERWKGCSSWEELQVKTVLLEAHERTQKVLEGTIEQNIKMNRKLVRIQKIIPKLKRFKELLGGARAIEDAESYAERIEPIIERLVAKVNQK